MNEPFESGTDAARGITNGCILALGIWSVLAAIAIGFCILTQVLK